jgi:proteic killer suppression protein
VLKSFADKETEKIWNLQHSKRLPIDIQQRALNKLAMISQAAVLDDLKVPPANRLEALKGDRSGQFSIRINQQWRICFRWKDGNAHDLEITDYH